MEQVCISFDVCWLELARQKIASIVSLLFELDGVLPAYYKAWEISTQMQVVLGKDERVPRMRDKSTPTR